MPNRYFLETFFIDTFNIPNIVCEKNRKTDSGTFRNKLFLALPRSRTPEELTVMIYYLFLRLKIIRTLTIIKKEILHH